MTLQLLHRAVLGADLVKIPRETFLRLQEKSTTPVEGQVAISYSEHRPVGAIFTLRDATLREREDQQFRQEQKMLAVGQLASDVAGDFCVLLSVVSDSTEEVKKFAPFLSDEGGTKFLDHMASIQRASTMGVSISKQLMLLGDEHSLRPMATSVNGVIATTAPILRKLCGDSLQLEIQLSPDSTSVLCHPHHLEQLLLSTFFNTRERLAGSGRIRIATQVVSGNREHVRLLFQIESSGSAAWEPLGFPFEMDSPDLSLSVANAIVTAAEGVLRFVKTSEFSGEVEITLPRQKASVEGGASFAARRGTVLLVGADVMSSRAIENQLESNSYVVISSPTVGEALLVAQLHQNKIDVVIADADSITLRNQRRLQRVFTDRNSSTKFLRLTFEELPNDRIWQSVSKPFKGREITAALSALLVDVESRSFSAHSF